MKDWLAWHQQYDSETSSLNQRLLLVREAIKRCLPETLTEEYTILDICAGDARDLMDVIADYPYRELVKGRLIELDPHLADEASKRVGAITTGLHVIQGDASQTHAYKDVIPADLILICGVFGNIDDAAIAKTIQTIPQFCKQGTQVIWTRHRRTPDRTDRIRGLFLENGFSETTFTPTDDNGYGVGVHMFAGSPPALGDNVTMFHFIK